MEYFLGTPHWLDALTPPVEQHIARLVSTIKRILETNPVRDIPPPRFVEPAIAKPAEQPRAAEPRVVEPPKVEAKPAITKPAITKPSIAKPAITKPASTKRNAIIAGVGAVLLILLWLASKSRSHNDGTDYSADNSRPSYAVDNPAPPFHIAGAPAPPPLATMLATAATFLKNGDTAAAGRQYAEATNEYPDSTAGHASLADLLGTQRYYRAAAAQARIWVRLAPKNSIAHNNLAWWLLYIDLYSDAFSEVLISLDLDDKSAYTWDTAGFALARLGRWKESENAFKIAMKIDPKTTDYYQRLVVVQGGKQPRLP
jgi:hypothetical protein